MKSELHLYEGKRNKNHKFGEIQGFYYPAKIVFKDGHSGVALFTADQIQVAIGRANRNPEDVPSQPKRTLWDKLFGSKA